MKEKKTTSKC